MFTSSGLHEASADTGVCSGAAVLPDDWEGSPSAQTMTASGTSGMT